MTWQRIDENTYIDDTLVTCAEYQLFIDEMREQGKYYQPDHWTSYQFPAGQALEPILGIRYSDAVTFCEWLTNQKENKSLYRIPYFNEGKNFPVASGKTTELCYWIYPTKPSKNDFPSINYLWINNVHFGPHPIDIGNLLNQTLGSLEYLSTEMDRVLSRLEDGFEKFKQNVNTSYGTEGERWEYEFKDEIYSCGGGRVYLEHVTNIVQNSIEYFDRSRLSNERSDGFFDLDYSEHTLLPEQEDLLEKHGIFNITDTFEKFYLNILKFEARKSGRSPAFEGIRLVKERIR